MRARAALIACVTCTLLWLLVSVGSATAGRPARSSEGHCPRTPRLSISDRFGWLVGCLVLAGGPAPGSASYGSPGAITVTSASGAAESWAVEKGHSYSLKLKPGHYVLSGSIEDQECPSRDVTVVAARRVVANVVCAIP
jgi:hypothetical protein